MSKNKSQSSALQKTLKLIDCCPVCNSRYRNNSPKMSFKHKQTNLVHITCAKCQSYFIAVILEIAKGTSTVGMVTDLNHNDLKRLYCQKKITLDEVIASCQELEHENIIKILIK